MSEIVIEKTAINIKESAFSDKILNTETIQLIILEF